MTTTKHTLHVVGTPIHDGVIEFASDVENPRYDIVITNGKDELLAVEGQRVRLISDAWPAGVEGQAVARVCHWHEDDNKDDKKRKPAHWVVDDEIKFTVAGGHDVVPDAQADVGDLIELDELPKTDLAIEAEAHGVEVPEDATREEITEAIVKAES